MSQTKSYTEILQNHRSLKTEKNYNLQLRVALMVLLNCSDKDGVFRWRSHYLKMTVLPYDNVDFIKVLDVLIKYDFIGKREEQGGLYGHIL